MGGAGAGPRHDGDRRDCHIGDQVRDSHETGIATAAHHITEYRDPRQNEQRYPHYHAVQNQLGLGLTIVTVREQK